MSALDRIINNIVGEGDCWTWDAYCDARGYGRMPIKNGPTLAHRISYELFIGPIPEGLALDHLCHTADLTCQGGPSCRHRACVNPFHLEPVTHLENQARGRQVGAHALRTGTCRRGHELTPDNTIQRTDGRRCKICTRALNRAAQARCQARKKGVTP
jgi:hypothetical protein